MKPVAAIATTGFCSPQNKFKISVLPPGTRLFFKKNPGLIFPNERFLLFPHRRYNSAFFTTR